MPPRRARRMRKRPARRMRKRASTTKVGNIYRYARYCEDSTLINQGPGDIIWSGAQAAWAIGAVTPDDNGLSQFGGSCRFKLNDVINSSEYKNLYDQYKITAIKLKFMCLQNTSYTATSSTGNTGSGALPTITYVIDKDDDVIPASTTTLLEKQGCKVRRLDKPFSVTITNPAVLTSVQSAGGPAVFAETSKSGWLNTNNGQVDHYGFKFYIRDMLLPDAGKNQNSLIRVQAKYYLSFKDPQ